MVFTKMVVINMSRDIFKWGSTLIEIELNIYCICWPLLDDKYVKFSIICSLLCTIIIDRPLHLRLIPIGLTIK